MYKSEKLIEELISAGIITNQFCDKIKARLIIRQYMIEQHNESVQATVIACNKKTFKAPEFTDQ
jgi:hypothetical protein